LSPLRHAILASLTLALGSQPFIAHSQNAGGSNLPSAAPEYPTENSISGIAVKPGMDGDWLLDFDYVFLGKPMAVFRIELIPRPGTPASAFQGTKTRLIGPMFGRNHISTVLQYPGEGTSVEIVVSLVRDGAETETLASARLAKVIQWPSKDDVDLRYAIDAIDNGSKEMLREARGILERLVRKHSNYAPAYIELARVAMKTNWGPEGLHHAETLLDSALKLSPQSADAKILLGYVYTHQQRFKEAETLFADAARSNPPNLWLWTNWGEMFDMQGKEDQAIAKYREALKRPLGTGRSYRARQNAYTFLLRQLEARKDLDGLEAVYKQRIGDFGPDSCYSADYARFKLHMRGDTQGAIDLARGALESNCDDAPSRQILGLASYVQWAKGSGASSAEALNQARIFLPPGPMALFLLAGSDNTLVAVKKLIASGESIDQLDDEHMSALGHALQSDKLDAAERLLRLGARPDIEVGYAKMPVALLPVLESNLDAVRLLQRSGVDYSRLKYQDATAIDFAKQTGDDKLLEVLQPKELAL
jgi:tetratricopeptide (TPR) repeat protein